MTENGAAPRTETRIGRRREKHDERRIMKKFYRISCFRASSFDRKSRPLGSGLCGVLSPLPGARWCAKDQAGEVSLCNTLNPGELLRTNVCIKSRMDLSHFLLTELQILMLWQEKWQATELVLIASECWKQ